MKAAERADKKIGGAGAEAEEAAALEGVRQSNRRRGIATLAPFRPSNTARHQVLMNNLVPVGHANQSQKLWRFSRTELDRRPLVFSAPLDVGTSS